MNYTVMASQITTGYPGEMLVARFGDYGNGSATIPAGFTNRVNYYNYTQAGKTRVDEMVFAAAGPTGNPSWSSSSNRAVSFLVGLVPVQSAPPPPPPPPPPADTFSYDALDRLTALTTAARATTTYAYAGDGLLASRGGTAYLWDRSQDPAPIPCSGRASHAVVGAP